MMRHTILVSLTKWSLVLGASAAFATDRDKTVPADFQLRHPCPSTGRTTGACPGWIKDHVVPLACGGPDSVSNLQWQTVEAAKAKDRWERDCWRWRQP